MSQTMVEDSTGFRPRRKASEGEEGFRREPSSTALIESVFPISPKKRELRNEPNYTLKFIFTPFYFVAPMVYWTRPTQAKPIFTVAIAALPRQKFSASNLIRT